MNYVRFSWYRTKQGLQYGALFGCTIVAPLIIFKGLFKNKTIKLMSALDRQFYSMLFGVFVSNVSLFG